MSGNAGYSSCGIVSNVNWALPHFKVTRPCSSVSTFTGRDGKDLTISARRRPLTSAVP